MSSRVPSKLTLPWLLHERRARDILQYGDQHKAAIIVSPEGKIVPGRYSHNSKNVVYDLREVEVSAEPVAIEPPYLTVTEDSTNTELDVSWTLPESYDALFLERSDDGITFSPLATLAGDASSYDDAAVTVGVEEWYRIRGQVGGAYSVYSNIDSGILAGGCVYALPDDMGSSTAFKQGFVGADYSDAAWNSLMQAGTTGITLSDNGRKIVVSGALGVGYTTVVLTREDDNSFTAQTLNPGTSAALPPFVISRNGIIAGRVESGATGKSAVWASGPTSAPTEDANINKWQGISADGTKLYGVTDAGLAIERTIGGSDVTIASGCWAIFGVNQVCGDCVIIGSNGTDDFLVYRNISGTWTHVATLADTGGATDNASSCIGINGDATKAFGSNAAATIPYFWDITGTGTINATAMGVPADDIGARCLVAGIASGGNLVVGDYEPGFSTVGAALYWLASESFATAHNLDLYLTSAGITGMGNQAGEYFSIDTVRCSAEGTQFSYRCQKGPSGADRNLFFAAVPAPT